MPFPHDTQAGASERKLGSPSEALSYADYLPAEKMSRPQLPDHRQSRCSKCLQTWSDINALQHAWEQHAKVCKKTLREDYDNRSPPLIACQACEERYKDFGLFRLHTIQPNPEFRAFEILKTRDRPCKSYEHEFTPISFEAHLPYKAAKCSNARKWKQTLKCPFKCHCGLEWENKFIRRTHRTESCVGKVVWDYPSKNNP